jgi:hypothetical protein
LEVLKERADVRHRGSPFVFGSWNGTKRLARNLLRAFYDACRKAKIKKFRFHDTRHTFSSRLVQRGVDLYAGKNWGGGNPWLWLYGMSTTTPKRCGPVWSGSIRKTGKLAQI